MVQHVAGKGLPHEVLQQLITKSDGVPLYIEEMTKNVLESGWLTETAGHFEITGPLPQLAIPATLQDAFAARLDRLAPVRELAQVGAVLGREFSYELIHAVSQLDDTPLQEGLRRLGAAEIVFQRGVPPDATYTFKHALLQDTAYASLLKSQRQQLHVRTAQVLEQQFVETMETHPELLAHHYTAAGLIAQAIPYWQRAGQRAVERSANSEAVSHLTKGLELLKVLPDTPERIQQELLLQTTLGTALIAIKGHAAQEVELTYARARELSRQVGETPELSRILSGLWVFYHMRAELETACELGEQLLTLAQRVQDPVLLTEAHRSLGASLAFQGEMVLGRAHLEQAVAIQNVQPPLSLTLFYEDPRVGSLHHLARVLWLLGYPEQAVRRIHEAITLARELDHPGSLAIAMTFAAWVHQFRREWHTAQGRAETLITFAAEHELTLSIAWGTVLRGGALTEQGRITEGIAQMREGLITLQDMGAKLSLSYHSGLLAETYMKAGQTKEGLTHLTEALDMVDESEEHWWEAELHRLKGEFTLQQFQISGSKFQEKGTMGNAYHDVSVTEAGMVGGAHPTRAEEAEVCFLKAIDIASKQQAKSLELRAATNLARLWQQQGKKAEARALLASVYNWFTEGFDTADLQDAKALLDELA
jgi:predicted ATPase